MLRRVQVVRDLGKVCRGGGRVCNGFRFVGGGTFWRVGGRTYASTMPTPTYDCIHKLLDGAFKLKYRTNTDIFKW